MNERVELKEVTKKRLSYIDIARALTIICVIIGHTVDSDTYIKSFLYAFHMPAFFFLSGVVYKKKLESMGDIKKFMIQRFKRLLIPYVIWGCIYSQFSFKNLLYICYGTRETLIRAESLTSLWFLPTLFVADILMSFLVYISYFFKKSIKVEILGAILFLLIGYEMPHIGLGDPLGLDIAFTATFIMLVGYLLKDKIYINNIGALIAFLGIGFIVLCFGVLCNKSPVGYVLMANAIYGNIVMFLIGAAGGVLLLVSCALILDRILKQKKYLIWIGKNTMGIFLVHKPFVEFFRDVVRKFGWDYNFIIITICIAIISLILSCLTVLIFTKIMPELLGKK